MGRFRLHLGKLGWPVHSDVGLPEIRDSRSRCRVAERDETGQLLALGTIFTYDGMHAGSATPYTFQMTPHVPNLSLSPSPSTRCGDQTQGKRVTEGRSYTRKEKGKNGSGFPFFHYKAVAVKDVALSLWITASRNAGISSTGEWCSIHRLIFLNIFEGSFPLFLDSHSLFDPPPCPACLSLSSFPLFPPIAIYPPPAQYLQIGGPGNTSIAFRQLGKESRQPPREKKRAGLRVVVVTDGVTLQFLRKQNKRTTGGRIILFKLL